MIRIFQKVRAPDLALMKERGERIVMLTAYDATMARLLDRAAIDVLLVGDSLAQVILGLDTTIPVTRDAVIHHTRAVTRATRCALVVADMPFLTYQVSTEEALRNAARLFQEGGAAAVKLDLIEVPNDPHDCSQELREWGSRVAVASGRAPRTGSIFPEV
jgi:3-methyl-2-oxobutanoate hydroxymethyltransferase